MVSAAFLVALLTTAAAAPAAAPPPLASLAWLPADTVAVTGAPGDQVSLLKSLRDTAKGFPGMRDKAQPACWDRVTQSVVASYQIWKGALDDAAAVLVQGPVDRARAESCIAETVRVLRASLRQLPSSERPPRFSLRMSRTGAITQFETVVFGRTYVGWAPGWVVWHPRRERVVALLAALRQDGTISPVLAAALARVDRSAVLWGADTRDDSTVVTGVPSVSWTMAVNWVGSALVGQVSFEYASPDDARRVAAFVTAASTDPTLAPELRALARNARVTVVDRFVQMQPDFGFVVDGKTLPALVAWLNEKKRAARWH